MLTAEEIKRFNQNLERVADAMEKLVTLLSNNTEENKETN